jgi:hypothetical protein
MAGVPGLSGLHPASLETWAGVVLLTMWGVLMFSTTCAICRGPRASPRSVGFAACGWGYLAVAHWYTYYQGPLPTTWLVPGSLDIHGDLRAAAPLVRIANEAWALVFAVIGGTLADRLFRRSSAGEPGCADEPLSGGAEQGWWKRPAGLGLVGFILVLSTTVASWVWDAGLGAGAALMLTWGFMGLATVGAVCARGRPREVWLGATSFGVGYMFLAFGPVSPTVLTTNHLLNAIARPSGPIPDDLTDDELAMDEASRRVKNALDEPIDHATYQPIPFEEDPVMIAGHSLLALFAAAIGGVASPIIASRCGRPGAN